MVNEEKLKAFVKSKCYDLVCTKHGYDLACNAFLHAVENYSLGKCDSLNNWLENLKRYEIRYIEQEYMLSQFCHQLGEEYVEIWNEIVEN